MAKDAVGDVCGGTDCPAHSTDNNQFSDLRSECGVAMRGLRPVLKKYTKGTFCVPCLIFFE